MSNRKGKRQPQRRSYHRRRRKAPLHLRLWRKLKRHVKRFFKRRKWLSRALLAALIIGAVLICWKSLNSRKTIFSTEYNGIDVSKHQGDIDWEKVADDNKIQFVYIKATEGTTLVDSKYKTNIDKARDTGLKVGSYHFFLGYKSPEDQFKNFCRQVDKGKQDLLPVIDVEEKGNRGISRKVLQQRLQTFMDLVKEEYGRYPIIYSQYTFYNTQLAPEFNKYIIFIARYSSAKPELTGGGTYNIWQYSEKGTVAGIKGTVDMDRFANGTTLDDISL